MRIIISALVATLLILSLGFAQDAKIVEASFKVFGNCGMCKNRIEKAMKIKEVQKAGWNKETKMLTVSYRPASITLDSLHQRLAAVGHDTPKATAPDSVYEALPGCCLYRDSDSTH